MPVNRERFKEILKAKGLKVTNQRIGILEVLADSQGQHLTAEEIYELVKAEYPEIGLATVYRTVQLLLELHLIDSINLNDGLVRYEIGQVEPGEGRHHHHHLICLECGKVLSFEDDLLEGLESRLLADLSFQVVDHEVKFFGYCSKCRKE